MIKRLFDIVISVGAMIILSIPCLIISIAIMLTSTGPIIYWSRRAGSNGAYFMMPKFRTMRINTPEVSTEELSDPKKYLTPLGSFLRRSSFDEFPQFFSVLKGDMSVVGPRPALHNQLDIISKRKELGIDVLRPGITGWAQINGRDNISLIQKLNFDQEYLKKRSIFFDLKIIILTILIVIQKKDIIH